MISPSAPAEGVEAAAVAEGEEALTQAARASVNQATMVDLSLKKRK